MQLPLALPHRLAPRLGQAPWALAVGGAGLAARFCLTRAFRILDTTFVVPFDCLRLSLVAVLGTVLYGEPPDPAVLGGAALIFAGTDYALRSERR